MRKTNKRLFKLADDKKGVILVTIIFIVAMALVFITTALTISIATRSRVYSNAKGDQARLTVTALAQSIWQAISMQQIDDNTLVELAMHDTCVAFTAPGVPGMTGTTDTSTTAYFYVIDDGTAEGHPFKIGIECKCEIDGQAQYYTLVLKRNKGEDNPPTAFRFVVNLGDGGSLNSCNIGFTVSGLTGATNTYNAFRPHTADDNTVFLHNPTYSGQDNMGFYSDLLTDGYLRFQDSVFARDVFFIGQNSGLCFDGGQLCYNGHDSGDMYFWGSRMPFVTFTGDESNPQPEDWVVADDHTFTFGSDAAGRSTVNDIYFDLRNVGTAEAPVYEGFEDFTTTFRDQNLRYVSHVYYEDGATSNLTGWPTGTNQPTWTGSGEGTAFVNESNLNSLITIDPDDVDTIGEVNDAYSSHWTVDPSNTNQHTISSIPSSLTAGHDYILTSDCYMSGITSCDLSGGNIYLTIDGCDLYIGENNTYFKIYGSSETNNLFIFLLNGAQIHIGSGEYGARDNTGIIDTSCFTSGEYWNMLKLDQTKTPRCIIYSLYTWDGTHYPVRFDGNQNMCLTAYVAFYPADTNADLIGNDRGGSRLYFYSSTSSLVYYGRISCGGLDTPAGGNLNVPYCPAVRDDSGPRDWAYRDNTDFSVVSDECMFFTA